jgi:hypothetical protein
LYERNESEKIANKTITSILANENLEVLLQLLEAKTDFVVTKVNNIVTIAESK